MVAGPGGGDVQQPAASRGRPSARRRGARPRSRWSGRVLRQLDRVAALAAARAACTPAPVRAPGASCRTAIDDRELEALRRVDGHHPHGVDVGLGQHRLGDPGGLLALPRGPGEVGPQPAVLSLRPGPGLVDDEPQPAPLVSRPRAGWRRPRASGGRRRSRRAPRSGVIQRASLVQPTSGRPARAPTGCAGQLRRRGRSQDGERAAVALPAPQVVVAAAEQRRPQRGDAATARRSGRRPPGRRRAGRGPRPPGRPASSTRPGRGCRPRRARPRGTAARSGPAPGRRCHRSRQRAPARPLRSSTTVQPLVERLPDGGGDVGRLALTHRRAARRLVRMCASAPSTATAGPAIGVGRGARRAARTPAGASVDTLDQRAEHVVDPVEDRRDACGSSSSRVTVSPSALLGSQVASRCRPGGTGRSTASGRRRRTADPAARRRRCQSAGVGVGPARDPDGELDLDRVGVLELVEQQPRVARRAAPARTSASSRSRSRASTSRSWNSSRPCAAPLQRRVDDPLGDPAGQRPQRLRRRQPFRRQAVRLVLRSALAGRRVDLSGQLRRPSWPPLPGFRSADRDAARASTGRRRPARAEADRPTRRAPRAAAGSSVVRRRCSSAARARERPAAARRTRQGRASTASSGGGSPRTRSSIRSQSDWNARASERSVLELDAQRQRQQRAAGASVIVVEQLCAACTAQRSSNATDEPTSSSTSISGGRPASIGCIGEDPLRERVQGADRGAVEVVERLRGTRPVLLLRRCARVGLLERARAAGRAVRRRPSR